jgi:ORF6N domain
LRVAKRKQLANVPKLDELIREIRGQKVMLDTDLARIYGIPTFRFNEAIKRNRERFPEDFMFRLTAAEFAALTSQFAISNKGRGGRRTLPYAFTEHGAIMAANVGHSRSRSRASYPSCGTAYPRRLPLARVLNSPHAVQMNTTCGDAVGWTALVAW